VCVVASALRLCVTERDNQEAQEACCTRGAVQARTTDQLETRKEADVVQARSKTQCQQTK